MIYGLGAIQSPPDDRDFLLTADFTPDELVSTLPASYRVPNPGPVYNQGSTPRCVAYSAAGQQSSFDLADLGHTYLWDFGLFFKRIGGTINGAQVRIALKERVARGYPLLPAGSGNSAGSHKISAYYSVAKTRADTKRALVLRGRLILSTPWFNSWFDPHSDGRLPAADYQVGGHAIVVDGYDSYGVWMVNSWGTDYGVHGRIQMSWSQLEHSGWEIWWAKDVKTGG